MSLMPWGTYGDLTPFGSFAYDPFFGGFDMNPLRTMTPAFRQMDRELGKLISSVKEDDKSFQV